MRTFCMLYSECSALRRFDAVVCLSSRQGVGKLMGNRLTGTLSSAHRGLQNRHRYAPRFLVQQQGALSSLLFHCQ